MALDKTSKIISIFDRQAYDPQAGFEAVEHQRSGIGQKPVYTRSDFDDDLDDDYDLDDYDPDEDEPDGMDYIS